MIAETILGRALSVDELALAASKPIESLPLGRILAERISGTGLRTAGDLARAPLDSWTLGPLRLRRVRQALLLILAENYSAERLENAALHDLPERVRELLGHLEERRRGIVEKANGLWDGELLEQTRISKTLGMASLTVQHDAALAAVDLRKLLKPESEGFKHALRSIYIKLLQGQHGMAGFHEWESPSSVLYEGQKEAALAFAFLCRASGAKPELLVTVGLEHVCYDGISTKYRHDQAVHTAKTALLNLGRPMPLDELGHWLKKKERMEASPEFLRRCFHLSRELGVEKSGAVGLRSWPYFDADSVHAMAHAALAAIGEPAHHDEIARKIDQLYPHRAPVNRTTLHTMLCIHKEEFVLARHGGIFGLTEWPVKAAVRLKDFLTDFLRENGGRAKRQDLLVAAGERGYKASSVGSILCGNKELFRRSGWGQWELAV